MAEKKEVIVEDLEVQSPRSSRRISELGRIKSWHGGPVTPEMESWQQGTELRTPGFLHWLANLLYLLFPAFFIVLAAIVALADGDKLGAGALQSDDQLRKEPKFWALSQVIKVAVTAYPILFGLVLCKLLKTLANCAAERGTTLSTLEQLTVTKSVGSAFTIPFQFKMWNLTTLALVSLWLTSPLTSQALQRMITTGTKELPMANSIVPMNHLNFLVEHPYSTIYPLNRSADNYQDLHDGMIARDIVVDSETQALMQTLLYSTTWATSTKNELNNTHLDANGKVTGREQSRDDSSFQDQFGNLRIPLISSLKNKTQPDSDGWYNIVKTVPYWPFSIGESWWAVKWLQSQVNWPVDIETVTLDWPSLAGLPLGNMEHNQTSYSTFSNFTTTTAYWEFDCSQPYRRDVDEIAYESDDDEGIYNLGSWLPNCHIDNSDRISYDNSYFDCRFNKVFSSMFVRLSFGNQSYDTNSTLPIPLPKVEFASYVNDGDNSNYAYSSCKWQRRTVEIESACAGGSCAVERMRDLGLNSTAYYRDRCTRDGAEDMGYCGTTLHTRDYLTAFMSGFMKSSPPQRKGSLSPFFSNSPVEIWMYDKEMFNADPIKEQGKAKIDLSELSAEYFSSQLSVAFNTYFQVAFAPTVFASVPYDSMVVQDQNYQYYDDFTNTVQNVRHVQSVYNTSWGWVAVVWISSFLVVVLIIANAVLQHRTLAPDIFGLVSALTYNNEYIPLPSGGNVLDGKERSKALKNLKVRLLDVCPESDVGHVALASVHGEALQQGRRYA